ncbi:MAG: hypothetical protein PHC74_07325 [Sulfurimonas sp.]|nr:hypothetical protein [Sulfurimonas sp.]
MRSALLALCSIFILTACTPSSLGVHPQSGIVLEHNKHRLITQTKPIEEKVLRFVNLDVTQVKLQNAAEQTLFYEKLETNHDYELKYASVETLKRIFQVSRSHTLYQASNLLFIQLQNKDGDWINILAETSGIQELSYVYGYTNAAFDALAQELGVVLQTPHTNVVVFEVSQTQWSQSDMFLNPLIQPIFRRTGLFF